VASAYGKPKNTESLGYSEVSAKGKAKLKKPHEVCGKKGTIGCVIYRGLKNHYSGLSP